MTDDLPNESPPPDPAGAPEPCQQPNEPAAVHWGLMSTLAGVAAVSVASLLILSYSSTSLLGSTQSSRLRLQERQAQIEQAIAAEARPAAAVRDESERGK